MPYINFTEGTGWIVLGILAFYYIAFAVGGLITYGLEGDFVVEGQLSVKNILLAICKGLRIPAVVTLIGLFVSVISYAGQNDECYRRFDACSDQPYLTFFMMWVLFIQALMIFLILAGVVMGLGYLMYRFVLKPVGRRLGDLYHKIRPEVPIRW